MALRGSLKKRSHRHFVFSIPKILRRYFLYDRSLLSELSRCVWGHGVNRNKVFKKER